MYICTHVDTQQYTIESKAMNPFIAPILHSYIMRTLHGDMVSATGQLAKEKSKFHQVKIVAHH